MLHTYTHDCITCILWNLLKNKTAYCNTAYMGGNAIFTSVHPCKHLYLLALHKSIRVHQDCMIWRIWWPVSHHYPIELWRWWAWRATHVFCHNYNGSMDDCKLEFVVPNFSQLNGYVTSEPTTIHSLPWYVYHHWEIFGEVVYSWTVNYVRFPYPRSRGLVQLHCKRREAGRGLRTRL